jgi:ubiquinone/menaquinone biosynthesis C-methylase UbiE
LNPNKNFVKADIKNLPFKDNEFDWAICSSIKQMIISNCGEKEWYAMQKELHRVCKKILILEYSEAVEQENYSDTVLQRGENGKI